MSKLGLIGVIGLALAAVACGEDKKEPAKNKCQVQSERATNECGTSVPSLGDPTMCTGSSECVATCAENATCEQITMGASLQGPVFQCVLNCLTGGSGDDPLCDQQAMRAQTECGIGGDAGSPIDVPCNGTALCVAQCSQAATCADLEQAAMDNTGPFATCSTNCFSGSP